MLTTLLAAANPEPINIEPGQNWSALGNLEIAGIVNGLVTFFLIGAAIIFFFILVMGGIRWIMSQGEEAKVKAARDQVTHALIGLVIVFAAWAIIKLIGYAFSIDLLQLNFPRFVQ